MTDTRLPYNLKLLPGIRSLHNGQQYQMGEYPSGKTVMVPYKSNGAEPARMIPVPPEPQRGRALSRRDLSNLRQPTRLHVIEWRDGPTQHRGKVEDTSITMHQSLLDSLRPFMRSPDCGKTWIALTAPCDWHVCYHLNAKE